MTFDSKHFVEFTLWTSQGYVGSNYDLESKFCLLSLKLHKVKLCGTGPVFKFLLKYEVVNYVISNAWWRIVKMNLTMNFELTSKWSWMNERDWTWIIMNQTEFCWMSWIRTNPGCWWLNLYLCINPMLDNQVKSLMTVRILFWTEFSKVVFAYVKFQARLKLTVNHSKATWLMWTSSPQYYSNVYECY